MTDKSLYCMLFMTRRCNLDCSYCHMTHTGYPDSSTKILRRAIDLLTASSDNVCLHLFGGEPLMRMDLIEDVVNYTKSTYPNMNDVKFMITTNGVLLRGKKLDFLLDNGVEIMLSLDGPISSQGTFRRAVGGDQQQIYDRVVGNIQTLNARGADYFLNMVISPSNVDSMEANVLYFKKMGVKRLQVTYELGANWCEPYRSKYVKHFCEVIEKYDNRYRGDPGFTLQHGPQAEPVLGNFTYIVDVDGEMYRGCAVVLENTMPRFNDVTRIGNLADQTDLIQYQRPRIAQVTDFLRRTKEAPNDWMLLRSNMHLGYQILHGLEGIQASRKPQRRRSQRV